MIITRTPLRISLVGGGTDMPSFYSNYIGGVVNLTIDKYVYVAVNKKFDGKIRVSYSKTETVETIDELEHDLVRESLRLYKITNGYEITTISDIPGSGSGLGSSSALVVGLLNAISHGIHASILAERAFVVEAESCHNPVGKQDQHACAFGGMRYYRFHKNFVENQVLYSSKELEENMLLLYTGISRSANEILKEQSANLKKDKLDVGIELSRLADRFQREYKTGMSYERMGELISDGWELKKQLAGVSNPEIDKWIDSGMKNGAYGGKLLGAGQGGFILFIAPRKNHAKIASAVGLRRVDFGIANTGSEIIYEG